MPLIILLLPLAAIALYLYSSGALASVDVSGGTDDIPLPDAYVAPSVPDYAVGLYESLGDAVSNATSSIARGLRNNNPGNVRAVSAYSWQGQTGSDGSFATFATPGDGIRALGVTLKNYQAKYGLNTVDGIINRWAPPSENNTVAYVNSVAAQLGVTPTQPIDVNDPATLTALTAAIIRHENGSNPFDTAMIAANVTRS